MESAFAFCLDSRFDRRQGNKTDDRRPTTDRVLLSRIVTVTICYLDMNRKISGERTAREGSHSSHVGVNEGYGYG